MEALVRALRVVPRWSRTCTAVLAGVGLVAVTPTHAWDGVPADPIIAIMAAVVAVGAVLLGARVPWPFAVWLLVASSLSFAGSYAVGSSWAFMTWIPLIAATLLVGRLSAAFAVGALGYTVLRDATTLVVLDQVFAAASFSGSAQYQVGFAAAAVTPFVLGLVGTRRHIVLPQRTAWLRLSTGAIALGLSFWAALASGSRSALVALACGLVVAVGMRAFRSNGQRGLRAVICLTVAGGVLVLPIDVAMTRTFGAGEPLAIRMLTSGITDSMSELRRAGARSTAADRAEDATPDRPAVDSKAWADRPGSFATRLALWRQAGTMLGTVPRGHGPASYAHVNHAYQREPLLWSGSPHSLWALAAVETGVLGLTALSLLVAFGLARAVMRRSMAAPALVAATLVMSLDVFASMPVASLLWWAVVGSAWGNREVRRRGFASASAPTLALKVLLIGVLALGSGFAVRLASPCNSTCDPIARYGGNPRLVGSPVALLAEAEDESAWRHWRGRYPLAFWLAQAHVLADRTQSSSVDGHLSLLRDYPFQSVERYVAAAESADDPDVSRSLAACALERFFDGAAIWRDWRSSADALAQARFDLLRMSGDHARPTEACPRVGLPNLPLGLR